MILVVILWFLDESGEVLYFFVSFLFSYDDAYVVMYDDWKWCLRKLEGGKSG